VERVPVTDPDDDRIREFIGLRDHELRRRREGRGGDLAGVFVAEGDVVVQRALRAGYALRTALVDATRTAPLPTEVPDDATVFAAGPAVLERITGLGVHRGVLAAFDRRPVPPAAAVVAAARRVVVLENVVNPTNVGVIARSAVAFGYDALLLDHACCDPLYRRAARVAMGEVYGLPHAWLGRLPEGLDVLRAAGFAVVALTPAPDAEDLDTVVAAFAPTDRVALLLGAEGHGLAAATVVAADRRVRIPIAPEVDSLNVGAAAAIALYALRGPVA
jgi:tRNA G18 (ribose-2'-O)-methylase SpoU